MPDRIPITLAGPLHDACGHPWTHHYGYTGYHGCPNPDASPVFPPVLCGGGDAGSAADKNAVTVSGYSDPDNYGGTLPDPVPVPESKSVPVRAADLFPDLESYSGRYLVYRDSSGRLYAEPNPHRIDRGV